MNTVDAAASSVGAHTCMCINVYNYIYNVFMSIKSAFVRTTDSALYLCNALYSSVQNISHYVHIFENELFLIMAVL